METVYKDKKRIRCDKCKAMVPEGASFKTWSPDDGKTWLHFCNGQHKSDYITGKYNLAFEIKNGRIELATE